MDIFSLIHFAKSRDASDVHLVASSPPLLRINGLLEAVPDMLPIAHEDIEQAFQELGSPEEQEQFRNRLELDFGYSIPDIGRLRCNVSKQRDTISMVIRLLQETIPTLEELGLPDVCKELVLKPRGLVVVSGPTGSGKSTTLASMINFLNRSKNRRVVTIEDPIEYIYPSLKCAITQRELGRDTHSFADALKHVLRQDPDLILVGEMRDIETAAAALTTAETGHLVMTTGHAPSASQAIERITDLFPPHERDLVQSRLASMLLGILCQTLVPRIDGTGRAPAVEVMLANPPVKNLIREGKIHQLPNTIRTHAQLGMKLLDQSLVDLYRKDLISRDDVLAFCNEPDEVTKLIGDPSSEEKPEQVQPQFETVPQNY
jgi:twitching motility protein PilT